MAESAKLTEAQRERLEMLAEEAGEVVQACTKILRHGYNSYNPVTNGPSNRFQLMKELLDVFTICERMIDYGDIVQINFNSSPWIWDKKLKYTYHQPPFNHPLLGKKPK